MVYTSRRQKRSLPAVDETHTTSTSSSESDEMTIGALVSRGWNLWASGEDASDDPMLCRCGQSRDGKSPTDTTYDDWLRALGKLGARRLLRGSAKRNEVGVQPGVLCELSTTARNGGGQRCLDVKMQQTRIKTHNLRRPRQKRGASMRRETSDRPNITCNKRACWEERKHKDRR